MRPFLRKLNTHGGLLAGVCLIVVLFTFGVGILPGASDLTSERKVELQHFLDHDCGSCHGMTRKGGLGSPLDAETLADKDTETLVAIILDGIPGTPMPPWRPLLTEEEALWIVHSLKNGKN